MPQVIHIRSDAPLQPQWGEPCNGCGVCCLLRPCPVGIVISRRSQGPCLAVRWDVPLARYRCGVLADAAPTNANARAKPGGWVRLRERIAQHLIAAGKGCDCDVELTQD